MATSEFILEGKMQRVENVRKALDRLTAFLRPALPFINSHLTEFYASSYWNDLLPGDLRRDLELKSVNEIKEIMREYSDGRWKEYAKYCVSDNTDFTNVKTLKDLVVSCGRLRSKNMGIATPIQDLRIRGIQVNDFKPSERELTFDVIMSAKKMHEVEVMSDLIAKLALAVGIGEQDSEKIQYLVDVGSGKGYLSSFLTLLHQFRVLAIDSSSLNTAGCEKRSAKLEKAWSQLVRRAIERNELGKATRRGKKKKPSQKVSNGYSEAVVGSVQGLSISKSSVPPLSDVNDDTKNKLLQTLTQFVSVDCDLETHLKEVFPSYSLDDKCGFGIIGLHTCGNLGVDSLRLFLANRSAKFICNVPCCYHLLDENPLFYPDRRFEGSKMIDRNAGALVESILKPTFPLCKTLDTADNSRFCLGRNARMMCAYSIEKMVHEEKGLEMHPSILHRSLLQSLLKEYLEDVYRDMDEYQYSVGKIGDKCKNFVDYCRRGLENLKLSSLLQLSDEEISNFYSALVHEEKERLHKYYLTRSIFAPLVEECILLDRLAFLLEHDSVCEAYIVEMFDPAISPRSHALFAVKS